MSENNHSNAISIPAYFVRLLLKASREQLTPRFYLQFLREVGLERFSEQYPPFSLDPTATPNQISNFMAKIYSITHEGVYPLFCQNLGQSLAKNTVQIPLYAEIKANFQLILQNKTLLAEQKISQMVEAYVGAMNYNEAVIKTVGASIVMEAPDCLYCKAITTGNPVCHVRKFRGLAELKWFTGLSFLAEQKYSVAQGDSACVLYFTPLDQHKL